MRKLLTFCLLLLAGLSQAQGLKNSLGDESEFYAETKQINQFFKRFNNEEDKAGRKYDVKDPQYRQNKQRVGYIGSLFDGQNASITTSQKRAFVEQVTAAKTPQFLEFGGGEWFAEVTATFNWKGREVPAKLFMELQPYKKGSRWVVKDVYFEPFIKAFKTDASHEEQFLHPMSHEVDFMNLYRTFQDAGPVSGYMEEGKRPDYVSMLFYETRNGNMRFQTVSDVKFHVFQIDGWAFEISKFNRAGYNSGWLISSLTAVENDQKPTLKQYIISQKGF